MEYQDNSKHAYSQEWHQVQQIDKGREETDGNQSEKFIQISVCASDDYSEKYKNDILTDEFILGYFCHLIQDALWFHDLVDKCIRCYAGEEKKLAYQRGYHDYERLNYLLINEFELAKVNFGEVNILVNEISTDKLVLGKNMFEQWFLSNPCRKEELDIYNWDIINDYINNSVDLCLSEISKLMQEENGLSPEELFVVA